MLWDFRKVEPGHLPVVEGSLKRANDCGTWNHGLPSDTEGLENKSDTLLCVCVCVWGGGRWRGGGGAV